MSRDGLVIASDNIDSNVSGAGLRLVVIDDDPDCLALVSGALEHGGLEILTSTDPDEGLRLIDRARPHIVLLDLMMPNLGGLEVLDRIMATAPGTEVVLMTAYYSTETAVEAIRKGASDYINKPLDIEALSDKIGKLVQEARQRKHALDLDREMVSAYEFHGIVSRSPLMLDKFALIRRIAPHFRTVLVTGSTGTGKELVARALHKLSPAASGPFVVCNCSAIVETLFESELFGYVKGAFTGAAHDKTGLFEAANGGVIFLDEIGEMPFTAQAKLLRAVQHQEISPVGSPAVRKLNVRVVAATNRDLGALAARREFRDDLYYRLSMVEIKVPDLADRREDLPLLERFYLERFSTEYGKTIVGITARAQMVLARHTWPGNVRELENVLGYACMMNETATVDVADLPSYLRGMVPGGEVAEPEMVSLDVMARRHTRRVLELVHGNKARAADVLGVSRATLYRLLADESRRKSTA